MEQIPFWEAKSFWPSQDISLILWKPKVFFAAFTRDRYKKKDLLYRNYVQHAQGQVTKLFP